jgi:L,D-transpeptidase ErfK/SrfK
MKTKFLFIITVGLFFTTQLSALTFVLPPAGQNVVGSVQYATAEEDDTLVDLGIEYDIGREEMKSANPWYTADQELPAGTPVVIPSRFILPDYPRRGLIINLSEMRLYYYPPNSDVVMTYPIGIGKEGHMTPIAITTVTHKKIDPYWIPPESIREFNKKQGIILPKVIRGGPDNPLGRRAIYLAIPGYLIHATNFPESIGTRGSFGCIRMRETDIDEFFPYIGNHTQVHITEEPYKAAWYRGQIYFEVHRPLAENNYDSKKWLTPVIKTLMRLSTENYEAIDWQKVRMALELQAGLPTVVSTRVPNEIPLSIQTVAPHWPQDTTLCRLSHNC